MRKIVCAFGGTTPELWRGYFVLSVLVSLPVLIL